MYSNAQPVSTPLSAPDLIRNRNSAERRAAFPAPGMQALLLFGFLVLAGCSRPPSKPAEKISDENIATVENISITATAFEAELGRHASPDKQAVLEMLVRRELLLAEAQRTGFDQRPEVQEAWRNFIINRFSESHREQMEQSTPPTAAEVQAFYLSHLDRYTSPERVHVALIFLRQPANTDPERKAELVQRMETLRDQALAEKQTPDFGTLAGKYSDHRSSRYVGGDIGWVTPAEPNGAWPAEVSSGIAALRDTGEISSVIATAQGVYLLKLLERQPATAVPLEKVRERVQYESARERSNAREEDFYAQLKTVHLVTVNTQRLEQITPPVTVAVSKPPPLPAH